jgi:hypothetical protein
VPIEPEKLTYIKELFELFKKPMAKVEGEDSDEESTNFFIDLQHVRESKLTTFDLIDIQDSTSRGSMLTKLSLEEFDNFFKPFIDKKLKKVSESDFIKLCNRTEN